MSDIRDEVDAIIDDRPETHRVFTEILQIDTEYSVWTFEDIEADTGLFGELVSRGIVEKQDDGYSLADPTAVDAALAHRDNVNHAENTELATDGSRSDVSETVSDDDHSRRQLSDQIDMSVDRVMETISNNRDRILSVIGVLALVVAFRLVAVRSVFQEGYVLLLGNDPYFLLLSGVFFKKAMCFCLAMIPTSIDIGYLILSQRIEARSPSLMESSRVSRSSLQHSKS
jgi:dolichyl-diphosphooligosaccharide--protein glycosyltransferase